MRKLELPVDQILCGDNVETLLTFPRASVDLTVTSPPYGSMRKYGGHRWDFDGVVQQLFRVTKPGGVVVWVVGDETIHGSETGTSFLQALRFKEIGFRLHDTMIYRKANFLPLTHNRYEQAFEYMFVFSKGKPKTFIPITTSVAYPRTRTLMMRNGDRRDKVSQQRSAHRRIIENVWTYKCGGGHIDDDGMSHRHPAPFPESLVRDHVLTWSNVGDVVLDPFAGSCTTCKIARKLGRRWIGIEINSEYVQIGRDRMRQRVLPLALDREECL